MSDAPGTGGPPYPEYPGQGQPSGSGYPPPGSGYPPPPPGSGQPSYPPGSPAGYGPGPAGYPPPNQGPQGGYPGYPGGYDERQGPSGWSGWAIAAFVVGLIIPLVGILIAIPLGIVALVKISGTAQKGKVLAIVGMVLSVLWWVGFILLGVYALSQQAERDAAGAITQEGRIDFGEIREGDCLSLPDVNGGGEVDVSDLKAVPCEEGHNAETVAIIAIDDAEFPGSSSLDQQSAQRCQQAVATATNSDPDFQQFRIRPLEEVWNDDNGHRIVCFAVRGDGADFAPLPGG